MWTDEVRAPLFARAQSCYEVPPSAQRLALEQLWSLRRAAHAAAATTTAAAAAAVAGPAGPAGPGAPSATDGEASTGSWAGSTSSLDAPARSGAGEAAGGGGGSMRMSSRNGSAYSSGTCGSFGGAGGGSWSGGGVPASHGGCSPTAARTLSEGLAAAMMQTAQAAAHVVQARARERISSNRSSRLTPACDADADELCSSRQAPPPHVDTHAPSTPPPAAFGRAAGGGASPRAAGGLGAPPAGQDPLPNLEDESITAVLLQQTRLLQDIDRRMHALEETVKYEQMSCCRCSLL